MKKIHHVWFLTSLWFALSYGLQQHYDQTLCSSDKTYPGTRYTCASSQPSPCWTYFVYRASARFATAGAITGLFGIDLDVLRSLNKGIMAADQFLESGHEILVPITCSCMHDGFFQANFTYELSRNETLSTVSCDVLDGLTKSVTLAEENLLPLGDEPILAGVVLRVPVKCACPDDKNRNVGVKYLVTYPFITRDDPRKVGRKFNVSVEEIWAVNGMDQGQTAYPTTTILVPLKGEPFMDLEFLNSDPPIPEFLPTTTLRGGDNFSLLKKACIAGSVVTFFLVVALAVACCLHIKALKKFKGEEIQSLSCRIKSIKSCSTPNSCLSPDVLLGIKYSLCTYTVDDLKSATRDFSWERRISDDLYKGVVVDIGEVMIEKTSLDGTRRAIDVHSRINHINIVKLHGVCYGNEDEFSLSNYLIFEFPSNGSLRECLSAYSSTLHWLRRTQIAFDIAMGVHYLHYSVTSGGYTRLTINSESIFLTSLWRAKITVLGSCEGRGSLSGWMAPEHIAHGVVSEKVDIFAFGVVLLELVSGKNAMDGKLSKESIALLRGTGGKDGGCFDQFIRGFVDPWLRDDYPLTEAFCLAVLASSCVEDDPLHRPSMEDVLKILARMV